MEFYSRFALSLQGIGYILGSLQAGLGILLSICIFLMIINQKMMETFIQKFCEKYNLPLNPSIRLLDRMEKSTFRKGDCLVREGERNSNFYIIGKGIWRGHYLYDGVDVSVWFASPGEAVFSTWGYVENMPSLVTIEAVCDSEIYGISKSELEEFFSSSLELANLGRHLFEKQFLGIEDWIIRGGRPRAEERYLTLLEETPDLLQCVPLKYLASYLWITPQSLSRIRAKIRKLGR